MHSLLLTLRTHVYSHGFMIDFSSRQLFLNYNKYIRRKSNKNLLLISNFVSTRIEIYVLLFSFFSHLKHIEDTRYSPAAKKTNFCYFIPPRENRSPCSRFSTLPAQDSLEGMTNMGSASLFIYPGTHPRF